MSEGRKTEHVFRCYACGERNAVRGAEAALRAETPPATDHFPDIGKEMGKHEELKSNMKNATAVMPACDVVSKQLVLDWLGGYAGPQEPDFFGRFLEKLEWRIANEARAETPPHEPGMERLIEAARLIDLLSEQSGEPCDGFRFREGVAEIRAALKGLGREPYRAAGEPEQAK